jgi:predicted nuclease of restriction endonuclease-like (RecB) superfamily
MSSDLINISSYVTILEELKTKIRQAQYKAVISANKEMIFLYWDIGKTILMQQEKQGWGAKVIDRLSHDLCQTFPDMKGLSSRNLKYMR